ncbi:MAG: AAA family ATPase [Eubacteriales bacterium]
MEIKSVNLAGFGQFHDEEIKFNNVMSIVYGPNEAGKSTIVDAIAGVLFGFKGRRGELKELKQRYLPKKGDTTYRAGLTLYIDGLGMLYIERDFLTNRAEVCTIEGGARSLSGLNAADILNTHLGISSFQLFKSTVLVRQEEIAVLAGADVSNALSKRLVNTDAAIPVRKVLLTLGNRYLELNRGLIRSTGSSGPIKLCHEEIKHLEQELAEIDEVSSDYEALVIEAESTEEKLARARLRLSEISPLIKGYQAYLEITKQRDEVFNRQTEIQTRFDKACDKIARLKVIEGSLHDNRQYERYLHNRQLKELVQKDTPRHSYFGLAAGLGLCLLSGLGFLMENISGYTLAVSLIAIGLALVFFSLAGKQPLHHAIDSMVKEHELLQESIDQYLDGKGEDELKTEISVLSVKLRNLRTELDLLNCALSADEYDLLVQEEELQQKEKDVLEQDVVRLRTTLNDFERFALKGKDRWTVENQLLDKKQELTSLEIKKKGIAEAVRILRESVAEAQTDIVPQVELRASKLLGSITGGRYEQFDINLDATGITVRVKSREHSEMLDIDGLSTGTRDQVYLAFRIAIAELVTGGSDFPLIFDDPFVNFDADRLDNTIKVLQKLAGMGHQVILLTKDRQTLAQYPEIAAAITG